MKKNESNPHENHDYKHDVDPDENTMTKSMDDIVQLGNEMEQISEAQDEHFKEKYYNNEE